MQIAKENNKLDAAADPEDLIEVEIQDQGGVFGQTLYVNVNGETILRIGRIKLEVEVTRS